MVIIAGVSLANITILSVLLIIYAKIYKSIRAVFTIGLMFFAGLFMLHNIISIYAYFAMEPFYTEGLLPYFVAISIAELAGIAILLKVTLD
jgi:hypothetical protein